MPKKVSKRYLDLNWPRYLSPKVGYFYVYMGYVFVSRGSTVFDSNSKKVSTFIFNGNLPYRCSKLGSFS